MERVHKPEIREWIGELINVNNFLSEWIAAPHSQSLVKDKEVDLMRLCNISESKLKELELECSESSLTCDYEAEVELTSSFEIPEGVNLETVKSQKIELDRRTSDPSYKLFVYNNCKYSNYPPTKILAGEGHKDSNSCHDPIGLPDVILSVQIYRPEQSMKPGDVQLVSRFPAFNVDQDLCVFGKQTLSELKDKISCVCDDLIPGDFSEDPTADITDEERVKGNSGFIFIHNTFYNDTRDDSNKDYSEDILKWSRTSAKGIGPFKTADMSDTHFLDLTLRLGYPYVYVHHGDCEHLIVFTDLRILNKNDNLNRLVYPMPNTFISKKPLFCMVCHCRTVKWAVSENKRLPEDFYVFCEECFFNFNYTNRGEKIGEFVARRYIDRTLLY